MVMSAQYKPGTYVKGNQVREAKTPAEAVKAVFEGFKLRKETPADKVEVAPENTGATAQPDPDSAQESSVDPTPDGSPSMLGFDF